jgi:hypothetical protein
MRTPHNAGRSWWYEEKYGISIYNKESNVPVEIRWSVLLSAWRRRAKSIEAERHTICSGTVERMKMDIDLAQEIIENIFKASEGSKNKPCIDFEMQAWKFIRAWIMERRKTVQAKRPSCHHKPSFCPICGAFAIRKSENNWVCTMDLSCGWKGQRPLLSKRRQHKRVPLVPPPPLAP